MLAAGAGGALLGRSVGLLVATLGAAPGLIRLLLALVDECEVVVGASCGTLALADGPATAVSPRTTGG